MGAQEGEEKMGEIVPVGGLSAVAVAVPLPVMFAGDTGLPDADDAPDSADESPLTSGNAYDPDPPRGTSRRSQSQYEDTVTDKEDRAEAGTGRGGEAGGDGSGSGRGSGRSRLICTGTRSSSGRW